MIRVRMRQTLHEALLAHRADGQYEDLAQHAGLHDVYLLVHYDFNAFAYNKPFGEPGFGFREAAGLASDALTGDAGFFSRIFLVNCLQGEEEAYRIAYQSPKVITFSDRQRSFSYEATFSGNLLRT